MYIKAESLWGRVQCITTKLNTSSRCCYKFPRERGTFKAKLFKGKYEAREEFPEEWGEGFQPKQPSVRGSGGYGYCLKTCHVTRVQKVI